MRLAPLTGASGLGPFREICGEIGDSVLRRVLTAEGVTPGQIEPGRWLPLPTMFGLMARIAEISGDEQFGIRLGKRMEPAHFGPWSAYCAGASTLSGMISRYIRTLHYHQPGARFGIERRGPVTLWTFEPAMRSDRGYRPHTDHIIWPMIRAIRRYAGTGWNPLWIEVGYARPGGVSRIEEAFASRLGFEHSSASIGIAFQSELLDQAWHVPAWPHGLSELRRLIADRVPSSATDIVRHALRFGDEDAEHGIEWISRMLHVAPRTLQRALHAEGTSFSEVLTAARLAEARRLLATTTMSVADVGYHLGYSYPPNFVRAFQARTGMSPGDYRRRQARS